MTRAFRIVFSIAAVVAVLKPLGQPVLQDGFPLSTYPMFVVDRSTAKLYRAVGLQGDEELVLPPRVITGDDQEPMLAALTLERAIKRDKKRRKQLCREVADAVAKDAEFAGVERVELRLELHDPVAYFVDEAEDGKHPPPLETKRRTRCKVDRGGDD